MSAESGSVFVDPVIDREFASRGYVVMPLLTPDDVQALLEVRRSTGRALSSDLYLSVYEPDVRYRRQIQSEINEVVQPRALSLLQGYKNYLSFFVDKRANSEEATVPIHQDATLVDPSRHVSVHLWVPLVDVNEDNGCLQVFPGTHSLVNHVCTMLPGASPYDGVMALLGSECGVRLPLAAGTGLFIDGRLLHGSENNRTAVDRPATLGVYVPQDCTGRWYVRRDASTSIDVMEVEDAFDVQVTRGGLVVLNPAGVRRVATEEHVVRPLAPAEIDHLRIRRAFVG
jgi:Phytanoyl-CoA dioxygenase (PhyH)